ncbi:M15 family metallopeptidase [Polaromonas sp.]|uniref:M15 family metallopeptidase n=1 Tax=Polaromonas sp. TaxID=1869339 RepID=UPI00356AE950
MKNSRSLDDLEPETRVRVQSMLARCAADPWFNVNGVTVLVTSTLRDAESQDALYAQGRTKPGKIVTNAQAWHSWHNFACAVDVVPLRNGIAVWGTKGDGIDDDQSDDHTDDLEVWERVAAYGEGAGLEWAGRWRSFKEYAHFQYTGGLSMADMRAQRAVLA